MLKSMLVTSSYEKLSLIRKSKATYDSSLYSCWILRLENPHPQHHQPASQTSPENRRLKLREEAECTPRDEKMRKNMRDFNLWSFHKLISPN
ncbi:hypothetical protein AV530_003675 [Patagioenas fasciata monilis]|uniref:Uncharacterized protein n=1 Tax=Patagioenas fasciata monilis TaxID=372326 RepID=A0A1V4KYB3_PATFA|nr:hypothetical protein AV530_003675 [Patagioenas fasciata monilis]